MSFINEINLRVFFKLKFANLVPEKLNKTAASYLPIEQVLPAVVVVGLVAALPDVNLQVGVVFGLRRPDPVVVHLPQVLQDLGALLRALTSGVTLHLFQSERFKDVSVELDWA